MKIDYLFAAEVINEAYDVQSTHESDRKYAYFIVYDDDITAVLRSAYLWRKLKKNNPEMKYVCVGGEGLLATAFKVMRLAVKLRGLKVDPKRLVKETEAQRLKRVAMALDVPEKDIIVLDEGRNTTENLRAMSDLAQGKKSLVVSTQRLAMVFKQSADYQCNTYPEKFGCQQFDYDMYVIHQKVDEILHWYNFQIAGDGRVAMHLFASLVRRFEVYDGKFLTKPFEPNELVKEKDALLRNKFLIKQRHTGWKAVRAMFQYVPIIWDIFWNAERYFEDEEKVISEFSNSL